MVVARALHTHTAPTLLTPLFPLFSAGAVDLEGLCIEEGALVWVLYLDVVCLVDDGNVLDAATVAAFLALRDGMCAVRSW